MFVFRYLMLFKALGGQHEAHLISCNKSQRHSGGEDIHHNTASDAQLVLKYQSAKDKVARDAERPYGGGQEYDKEKCLGELLAASE